MQYEMSQGLKFIRSVQPYFYKILLSILVFSIETVVLISESVLSYTEVKHYVVNSHLTDL